MILELMIVWFGVMGYSVEVLENENYYDCLPNEIIGAIDFECHTEFVNYDTKTVYFGSAEVTTDIWKQVGGSPKPFPHPDRLGLNIFEHTMLMINCKECNWDNSQEEQPNHHYTTLENTTKMLDLMTVQYNKLGFKVKVIPTVEKDCLPINVTGVEGCYREAVNYGKKTVFFYDKLVTTDLWKYDIDSWGFNIFEHATLHITAKDFHPFGYSIDLPLVINNKITWVDMTHRSYPEGV